MATRKKTVNFEKKLVELEDLVEGLESGGLSLEESLKAFEKGIQITRECQEALKDADGQKGNRNEIEGKAISGIRDVIRPDGGPDRRYQTLWFRTYRYVQLNIRL